MSARGQSRPARWAAAIAAARTAIDTAKADIESAFADLQDIQSEYQDWLDNLPDMAQGTALNDNLDEVTGLDLDADPDVFSDIEALLDEAEGVTLPRGFGRD